MTDPVPLFIRPAEPGDLGLIVSTWVGSHRQSARWLSRDDHDRLYRHAVKRALETCTVLVACHPEHRDHLYGWVCHENPILHYVFVKSKFRRLGIARQLLREARRNPGGSFTATAWTIDGQHLATAGLTTGYRPDLFNPGGSK